MKSKENNDDIDYNTLEKSDRSNKHINDKSLIRETSNFLICLFPYHLLQFSTDLSALFLFKRCGPQQGARMEAYKVL